MNKKISIEDYVSKTRRNRKNLVNEDYYAIIFQKMEDLFNEAKITGKVHVVHSSLIKSEIVKIDEEPTIIFDQNIGQVFNQLNRIFFESEAEGDGLRYVHKLGAQFMSNFSSLRPEAILSISLYQSDRKKIPYSDSTTKRFQTTQMQECYVLAHEMMHHIYSIKDHRYHDLQFVIDSFVESYLEASDAAYNLSDKERELRYSESPDAALGESIEYGQDSAEWLASFRKRVKEELLNCENIKEEIFCDFWAAMWTAAVFYKQAKDCIEAIFLSHFHLRVLTEINWAVRQYANMIEVGSSEIDYDGYGSAFSRSRINLELCSFLSAAISFHAEVIDPAMSYEKLVGDLVFLGFSNIRLATMTNTNLEMLKAMGFDATAAIESARRNLISVMAKYYRKIYDPANAFMFRGILGKEIYHLIEGFMMEDGQNLEDSRVEMDDPVDGKAYMLILEQLIS